MRTLFLIALVALGPTVLEPLVGPVAEVCTDPCQDDDEQGRCAPDCSDCTCCGHSSPSMTLLPPSIGLSFVVRASEGLALPQAPKDPDGRRPRQVPKARAA